MKEQTDREAQQLTAVGWTAWPADGNNGLQGWASGSYRQPCKRGDPV